MFRTLPIPLRLALALVLVTMLLARGWMGQAMAMDMAPTSAPVPGAVHGTHGAAHGPSGDTVAITGPASHAAGPTDPAPCHGSADSVTRLPAAASHDSHEASAGDASHCGTCTLCQVCHSVAMTDDTGGRHAFALPQAAPVAAAHRFASAEPQPGLKPPIS
jgi:hypothetical protein